jgi:hypothetical protein
MSTFRGVSGISANCGVRGTVVGTHKVVWPANVGGISNDCCHREASQHHVFMYAGVAKTAIGASARRSEA